jgi:hypothetical protein
MTLFPPKLFWREIKESPRGDSLRKTRGREVDDCFDDERQGYL